MSTFGKIVLGAAKGLGGYFDDQAKAELEDRKQRVTLEREKALAVFNSGLRKDEATHAGTVNSSTYSNKVATDVAGEVALLGPKTAAQKDVASHQSTIKSAEAERDFLRDIRKLEVEHGYKIDESKIEAGLQQARDAANDGRKVVATGVNNDGDVVVTYGNNRVTTMRGLKPTPHGKPAEDPFGLDGDTPAAAASAAAGKPTEAADTDMTQFNGALAEAAQKAAQGDPRFKGKSSAQIRQDVIDLFKRNGLPAPTK